MPVLDAKSLSNASAVLYPGKELTEYVAKPTLDNALRVGLQSAGVGVVVSTIQNALEKHSLGATGALTRTGGTIGFFAALGATFAFTESYVANRRQTDDHINGAVAGCAAGFLTGVRHGSLPVALGSCAFFGGLIGMHDYAGGIAPSSKSWEERRKRFFKEPSRNIVPPPKEDE
ncbi:NADH dehydrogenase 1 alpha subcomplex [Fistulina hepatica ATCC 64428]|uniref:NADH dehydrogenase 1 alpha subcomplex n=1 Tax=Fistulina hepatica ATCC 64428 TaxID=1128425 RepID=A0A0D7AIE1_9AGAR|nr:NADH dehydrogenase 1 alpha subcomplex [Fistulina hepatica ATCC 64428]